MVKEQTLILLKPDTIQRGLIGKIITRFEDAGLKIIGAKMLWADDELTKKHYHVDEQLAKAAFQKTRETYEKEGEKFPHKDHLAYGKIIQKWNKNFLCEGPVIALVLEAPHAIEIVRKMVGPTEPRQAAPGTIRGDFAVVESYVLADTKERVIRNLIHSSDSKITAEREIALWFNKTELHAYAKELDKHF